jgi:8-oxo-dGTP pyrophosphatase MutT (NUDIX family)
MNKSSDSVRIVLHNEASPNQFVVLTETDDPDNLKLPGGRFEDETESPDEAAARELMEELGVTPEEVSLKRAGELVNDDGSSKRYIYTGSVALNSLNLRKKCITRSC